MPLGRTHLAAVSIKETMETAGQAVRTTEEILPAVETMAQDYQRISPLVNFLADYWSVAAVTLAAIMAAGAAAGSWVVLKRLEKKKR